MGDGDDWVNNQLTDDQLARLRRHNNPGDEPTGDYTGRCQRCGSKDLWTDNLTYGCNRCGAIYIRN